MAKSPVVDYALRLHQDAEECRKFSESRESAKQAMRQAGVSESHQSVLLSGDKEQITATLTEELGEPNFGGGGHNNVVCNLSLNLPNPPS